MPELTEAELIAAAEHHLHRDLAHERRRVLGNNVWALEGTADGGRHAHLVQVGQRLGHGFKVALHDDIAALAI